MPMYIVHLSIRRKVALDIRSHGIISPFPCLSIQLAHHLGLCTRIYMREIRDRIVLIQHGIACSAILTLIAHLFILRDHAELRPLVRSNTQNTSRVYYIHDFMGVLRLAYMSSWSVEFFSLRNVEKSDGNVSIVKKGIRCAGTPEQRQLLMSFCFIVSFFSIFFSKNLDICKCL